MKIEFYYEYVCGGDSYTHTLEIEKNEFEEDKLSVLVCSYLKTECRYPGPVIDEYLHNRIPEVHTQEDMLGNDIYNIYSCSVDDLKQFSSIARGLLSMNGEEAFKWMETECQKYNDEYKEKSFSIWMD